MSFEVAAAIGVVGTTAHQGLIQIANLDAGDRVLIFGGSSAVGSLAIQIAKLRGAHVTTTASSRSLNFVSSFGAADKIINYNEESWEEDASLKAVDVIFDTIGEKDELNRAFAAGVGKEGGKYISIANFSLGFNPSAYPPFSKAAVFGASQHTGAQNQLVQWISEGKVKLIVEETFSFTSEGVQAFLGKIHGGKSLGKNVLVIG